MIAYATAYIIKESTSPLHRIEVKETTFFMKLVETAQVLKCWLEIFLGGLSHATSCKSKYMEMLDSGLFLHSMVMFLNVAL